MKAAALGMALVLVCMVQDAQAECDDKNADVRSRVGGDWLLVGDRAYSLESGGTMMNFQCHDDKLYAYVQADIETSKLKNMHRSLAKLAHDLEAAKVTAEDATKCVRDAPQSDEEEQWESVGKSKGVVQCARNDLSQFFRIRVADR